MLRSQVFSRPTACVGILAHALSLADYLRQAFTASAVAALLIILPNALLLVIWYLAVGRRLCQAALPVRRALPQVRGQQLDLEVSLEPGAAAEVGLRLLKGPGEETVIGYDAAAGRLYFDRSRSGAGPGGARWVPVALQQGRLTLRILVDRISVEVFANGGERALTGLVYPAAGSDGVELFARGGPGEPEEMGNRGAVRWPRYWHWARL